MTIHNLIGWLRRHRHHFEAVMPNWLLSRYRRSTLGLLRRFMRAGTPRDIFADAYRNHRWGGENGDYYSGAGSTKRYTRRYCALVRRFIVQRHIRTVVDLGCGDWRVGSQIQVPGVAYVGVDVVDELIARNRRLYGKPGVEFRTLDVTTDPLPAGDLCIVRQVLQHLSNSQIQSVLSATRSFPYVLVTEHYPSPSLWRLANRDKRCGWDVRVIDDSAVCLDRPPFNETIHSIFDEVELASDFLISPGERIMTVLINNGTRRRANCSLND